MPILQFLRLLARTLEQRAPAADRGAHRAGQRIGPGIARDPHRRLDLVEAEGHGGCGIGRELQRIVLGVGHMGLVARRLARPHLGIGEGDLERIQLRDALRRAWPASCHGPAAPAPRAARSCPPACGPRLRCLHRHGLGRDGDVDVVARDEAVDHVEVALEHAVQRDHAAVLDADAGLRDRPGSRRRRSRWRDPRPRTCRAAAAARPSRRSASSG